VPDEWRTDLFDLIRAAANLDWLLVTKRIGNAKAMLPPDWGDGWPHVMLIATVVDQDEADRDVPKLIGTPAERRGVSYEPALGLVDFRPWLRPGGLDWIIVGGESDQGGRKARPFHLAWAASIVMQGASAGVPVFVKQLGSHPMIGDERVVLRDRAGGDMGEWEPFFGVRQFPRPEARP
jgi:protein gp37